MNPMTMKKSEKPSVRRLTGKEEAEKEKTAAMFDSTIDNASEDRLDLDSGHGNKGKTDDSEGLFLDNASLVRIPSHPHSHVTLPRKRRIIFEGIDLAHPLVIPRESTCDKILVLEERAMLIRGPPFSGKTSLATLLYKRAQSRDTFKHIVKCTMLCNGLAEEKRSHNNTRLSLQSLFTGDEQWLAELGPVLVIVDEIQMIYDQPEASFFWNAVKAMQQSDSKFKNVFLIMLGSFGGDTSIREESASPVHFHNPRGLEVIRFSPEEYSQLVSSFNRLTEPQQFALNERMSQALFNLTLGVPGLTAWALQKFQSEYIDSDTVCVGTPTETDFMGFLLGRFVELCVSTRAISHKWMEREDAVAFVKHLLENESNPPPLRDLALETLLTKQGVVTRQRGVLQFSCPIIRSVVMKMLFFESMPSLPSNITPLELRDFDCFLACCLQRMKRQAVCDAFDITSEGNNDKMNERALEMEFYRAAVPLADRIGGICFPDAGVIFGSNGFLDFYVKKKLNNWTIELMQNNAQLDEHLSRFDLSTGIYFSMPIDKWAVVNFVPCQGTLSQPRDLREGEVRVLFSKTDGKFIICRKKGRKVVCNEGSFAE